MWTINMKEKITPYLIQRCRFKEVKPSEATGFDAIAELEYMGSAEFEFGALPASLREATSELEKYQIFATGLKKVSGQGLFLFCKEENLEELKKILLILAKPNQRFRLKERMKLAEALADTSSEKTWSSPPDLFWDIENHWFAGFGKENMRLLEKGLQALQSRWKREGKI